MTSDKRGSTKRGGKKRRDRVDQHHIRDGERLRLALRAVVRHLGGVREAARKLGLDDHTTFNRLLTGEIGTAVTPGTRERIGDALIRYAVRFEDSLIREAADAFLDAFEETPRYGLAGEIPHRYEEWLDGELQRLQAIARPAFDKLWESPEHQRTIMGHLKKATRHAELPGPEQKRLWLALLRAVEPLGATESTWGVERSWEELSEEERRGFLDHSLHRERILLEREGDIERMNLRPVPPEVWDEYWRELENTPPPPPISPDDPAHLLLELDQEHPPDDGA